jgi:23S rRNA pseudouridine1911/1915/1917 synthase
MKIKASKSTLLLDLLQELSPQSSKNTLRSWVEQGRVSSNGCVLKKANMTLQEGSWVEVGKRISFSGELKILYEDHHITVIDKPAGLLSVATDFEKERDAHTLLKHRSPKVRVFPVHRLDRETSGILVFAHTEKARTHLKGQFFHHSIQREYHAFVEGRLESLKGTWKSTLVENEETYYVTSHPEKGQLAITHYEVIQYGRHLTHLKLLLETGRKNQIRVHCKEAGHPIRGDKKYGGDGASRLYLHAARLEFMHPHLNKTMSFTSPLPFTLK